MFLFRSFCSFKIALIVRRTARTDLGVALFCSVLLDIGVKDFIRRESSTLYRFRGKIPGEVKAERIF